MCFFYFSIIQRSLYGRFKRRYFTDDDSDDDEDDSKSVEKSATLCVDSSDTFEICSKTVCSVDNLFDNKLNASVLRPLPSQLQSIEEQQLPPPPPKEKQQEQQLIVAEMGDSMENNHVDDGGDVVRKISPSEETEKDDKFPQQMAKNSKSANWNTMELGEKRKRLR